MDKTRVVDVCEGNKDQYGEKVKREEVETHISDL